MVKIKALSVIAAGALLVLNMGVAHAQKNDGKARSVARAEEAFNRQSSRSGLNNALQGAAASTAVIFNPNPVDYSKGGALLSTRNITYNNEITEVSASADLAYTTGSYTMEGDSAKVYGDYLTLWKDDNGTWKIAAQMKTEGPAYQASGKPLQINATRKYQSRLPNEKAASVAQDILLTTEQTLNTTLKTYGAPAFAGFTTADTRLLFMSNAPITGTKAIVGFLNPKIKEMKLVNQFSARANAGDLAYTYGQAVVDYKIDLRETLNYLFVWKLDEKYNWNIVQMIMVPAER